MIDWHTTLLILAVLLCGALLLVLWETITNVIFFGALLLVGRLITGIVAKFRKNNHT